jgi:hypothetical protein
MNTHTQTRTYTGVLFLTLSPADIESAVRSGLTLMLQDVCLYTRRRITEVGTTTRGGRGGEGRGGFTHTHTFKWVGNSTLQPY